MSIWDRLEKKATGMRRPDRVSCIDHGPRVALGTNATGHIRPTGFAMSREYEMLATLSVVYWANDAQFDEAHKAARAQLAAFLYSDFIAQLAKIGAALHDVDVDGALVALAELEETILRGRKLEC